MQTTFSKTFLLSSVLFLSIGYSPEICALNPTSFREMYRYASTGNLHILNNAIHRGLNIDSRNADGDTAICIAIKRNDHRAYKTLKLAGASIYPDCIANINSQQYKRFMASEQSAGVSSRISPAWLWGGAALGGGAAIALAAGGGGGGGSGEAQPAPAPEKPTPEPSKPDTPARGLGALIGKSTPIVSEGEKYMPVLVEAEKGKTLNNTQKLVLANDFSITLNGEANKLSDLINFDTDINQYADYIQAAIKGENASITNNSGTSISLGNNTTAIDAIKNSNAINYGIISITAQNGTIGMIASDNSEIKNTETIDIKFNGTAEQHEVIGLYADVNSSAINSGTINAASNGSLGKIIGIETRLTTYSPDFASTGENSGTITLSGNSPNLSLWGMSSLMDVSLATDSSSNKNLDNGILLNHGTISLTLNNDTEESTDGELSSVIGIRADANTAATNDGSIIINVTGTGNGTVAAGMQSAHGGSLDNKKEIKVSAESGAYGMMATAVTENSVFGTTNSTISNTGTIDITGTNAYGIYQTAGKIKNSGSITVNGSGYGIYAEDSVLEGEGNIKINNTVSDNSYGIYLLSSNPVTNQNNIELTSSLNTGISAAGYGIYALHTDFTNLANITMNHNSSAYSLTGLFGNDGNVTNQGEINITGHQDNYGMFAVNGSVNNDGTIKITTAGQGSSYGIYANAPEANVHTITNNGTLTVESAGAETTRSVNYGIYSQNTDVTNSGTINMNIGSATGIYATGANITNDDTIIMSTSSGNNIGIQANSGSIENNGSININYSGGGTIKGIYNLSTASVSDFKTRNDGNITIKKIKASEENDATTVFGINANGTVENSGNITIGDADSYFLHPTYGIYGSNGTITNSGTISSAGALSHGIFASSANVTNTGSIDIQAFGAAFGIELKSSSSEQNELQNSAKISITDKSSAAVNIHGISGNFASINNSGEIVLNGSSAKFSGIYAIGGAVDNSGPITIQGNGTGIYGNDSSIVNRKEATIKIVTSSNEEKSYGIMNSNSSINNAALISIDAPASTSNFSADGLYGGKVVNTGSIAIGSSSVPMGRSTGIYASVLANNSGDIQLYGTEMVGIEGLNITNSGDISITGNDATGIFASDITQETKLTNTGNITIEGNYGTGIHSYQNGSNEGKIRVSGDYPTGIFIENLTSVHKTFTNKGTIALYSYGSHSAAKGKAIIAKGEVTVINEGTIFLEGANGRVLYACDGGYIENHGNIFINNTTAPHNILAFETDLHGGSHIYNNGTINYYTTNEDDDLSLWDERDEGIDNGQIPNYSDMDFSEPGNVTFGAKAKFVAKKISGNIAVSQKVVQNTNQTEIVLSDNFEGDTSDLTVTSESYLYDADFDGRNTVLTMKKFADTEDNGSVAAFLQKNYAAGNKNDFFNELKSALSRTELNAKTRQKLGLDSFPSFARQNLDLVKELDFRFGNDWFDALQHNRNFNAGITYYKRNRSADGFLVGSDENAVSLLGLLRHTDDNLFSYGLGWNLTSYNVKYDNSSKRKETIVRLSLPLGWNFGTYGQLAAIAYGGYGNGEFKHYDNGIAYRGNLQNYYYGASTQWLRHIQLGNGFTLQPTAGLYFFGLYSDGYHDGWLKIQHNNNLSLENRLGIYLQKELRLGEKDSLKLSGGGSWYHEFNDNYQTIKAAMAGMEGSYGMEKLKTARDRGLFSIGAAYKHDSLSLSGNADYHWQKDDGWSFNFDMKYAL